MTSIGFVGLGHMGLPMAINLINAGYTVTGFDLNAKATDLLAHSGGRVAANMAELATQQDVIITMLQTGEQVRAVCLGQDGIFKYIDAPTLFIDCSSIDVESSQEIQRNATSLGILAVDAPVSGGVAGAKMASLTFMVGGSEEAFAKAETILASMGKKIIYTGVAGSGQAAKICNNMILGMSMIAISEAFVLADHLGLAPQKLYEVVTNASGQCWAMSNYVPVPDVLAKTPANNNYQPGFTAAMMWKDLKLSQQAAVSRGVATTLAAQATSMYQHFNDIGLGELDFSAIIKMIRDKL